MPTFISAMLSDKICQCSFCRVRDNILRRKVFLKSHVGKGIDLAGTLDKDTVLNLDCLENRLRVDYVVCIMRRNVPDIIRNKSFQFWLRDEVFGAVKRLRRDMWQSV